MFADPQWHYLQRLAAAAALGMCVGAEREARDKAAGMRTQALVCSGAAAFALASAYGFPGHHPDIVLDPSRIAAQVATGVGFLGAGAIVIQRERVLGLTTAATIWLMAAVGLLCGAGMMISAAGATVLGLIVLEVVDHTVVKQFFRRESRFLKVTTRREPDVLQRLEEAILSSGGEVPEFRMRREEDGREVVVFRVEGTKSLGAVADKLGALPGVERIEAAFRSEL